MFFSICISIICNSIKILCCSHSLYKKNSVLKTPVISEPKPSCFQKIPAIQKPVKSPIILIIRITVPTFSCKKLFLHPFIQYISSCIYFIKRTTTYICMMFNCFMIQSFQYVIRRIQIIAVHKGDVFSTGYGHGPVSGRACTCGGGLMHHRDSGIARGVFFGYSSASVGGGVIHNEHFDIPQALGKNAVQAFPEVFPAVPHGNNHADRWMFHGYSPTATLVATAIW